ncbi:MAG TPA: hypothetical protein VNF47_04115, partial [Streptosporangiaceae bacterium]|nr:hypothetical protein [Streptosporangiaceae bacterium]
STCPKPSRQSDHWYPTALRPGNPPEHREHASTPGNDVPSSITHHVVRNFVLCYQIAQSATMLP